jgi:hypothetical protein
VKVRPLDRERARARARQGTSSLRRIALFLVVLAPAGACQETREALPQPEEVAEYYPTQRDLSVEIDGNVAEITVQQPEDQLRRGGPLWAKVGPYIFLFSEGTRDLFEDYPALAGVQVITRAPNRAEVARALLERDKLNRIGWRRAINIAGRARVEGTRRVRAIEELVLWGEEQSTFRYAPAYVP